MSSNNLRSKINYLRKCEMFYLYKNKYQLAILVPSPEADRWNDTKLSLCDYMYDKY